jgi:putative nucleotidyltransferase with HDIG domain
MLQEIESNLAASVLIVDDQEMVKNLLARLLSKFGYETLTASNAGEAVQRMKQHPCEAAILDIHLPGKDGIQLLREMKASFPETAIIMMSAAQEIETALLALKLGAYDYITKPFHQKAVESCLQRALEKRELLIRSRAYQKSLQRQVKERTRDLEEALARIEFTYDATIKALGAALDLRDSETENHCLRVAGFVLKLARSVGIEDSRTLRDIEWGAYLHDIGKIGIPDAILMKPGRLTAEEREVIKQHPLLGYRLLNRIRFLQGAAELVLAHHEWYDGSGYPRGLAGKDIPLSARLFAVADTIDAMTSDRPYRKALPVEAVGKELMKLAGIQFDPVIVEAFLLIPKEEWGDNGAPAQSGAAS